MWKSPRTAKLGAAPQSLFDFKESVVLSDALRSTQRASLDLPTTHGHSKVGDKAILRFA